MSGNLYYKHGIMKNNGVETSRLEYYKTVIWTSPTTKCPLCNYENRLEYNVRIHFVNKQPLTSIQSDEVFQCEKCAMILNLKA